MKPVCDYHMHTPLCGHAHGQPAEYAAQALKVGLEEIGFSDHAPLVSHRAPGITMDFDQLPQYYRMIEDVRAEFKDKLRIKIAIEADFIPGYETQTKELLDDYPYDYVLGSVHFMVRRARGEQSTDPEGRSAEGSQLFWGFDNPDERNQWTEQDVNQVYRDYFVHLRQSAQSGLFDIIAHADLVKKFGHRPTEDMTDEIENNAKVFKDAGVAVEINTSGLRKEVKEMYPALSHLKIYAKAGVPLTFGSDAHAPELVGCDFDKALELAKAAGFGEYVLFRKRRIERTIKI